MVLSKEVTLQQVKPTANNKSGRYSQVAVSRSKDKKTSFRMMLHKEVAQPQNKTMSIKTQDNDLPCIVTISQDENADLREMLNKFYDDDSVNRNKKNVALLQEIIAQGDYLNVENKKSLINLMEQVVLF